LQVNSFNGTDRYSVRRGGADESAPDTWIGTLSAEIHPRQREAFRNQQNFDWAISARHWPNAGVGLPIREDDHFSAHDLAISMIVVY